MQRNASLKDAHKNGDFSFDALKGTLTGMGVGAVIGVGVALQKKWSLLFCAAFGSLAGGVISKAFVTAWNNNKTETDASKYEEAD